MCELKKKCGRQRGKTIWSYLRCWLGTLPKNEESIRKEIRWGDKRCWLCWLRLMMYHSLKDDLCRRWARYEDFAWSSNHPCDRLYRSRWMLPPLSPSRSSKPSSITNRLRIRHSTLQIMQHATWPEAAGFIQSGSE